MTQNRDYRDDGTRLINNVGKKVRFGFVGSEINPAEFEVVSVGSGMTAGIVSNALTITTGTTANAQTIIRSREVFTVPSLMEFQISFSQRIANQEFRIEYVSVNKDTLQPDNRDLMGWMFDGTSATSARITHASQGAAASTSGLQTVSSTVAPGSVFAVQPTNVEGWWHSQGLDSNQSRSFTGRRHQNIPDCNAWFKIQIRVTNLATPPASTTTMTLPYIVVSDYSEVIMDFASAGSAAGGLGFPVHIASAQTGTSATHVQGSAAFDSAVAGNPVRVAGNARTGNFSTLSSNDVCDIITTLVGAVVVRPYSIPELEWQTVQTVTNTTQTAIQSAAGAGLKRYMTAMTFQNTNATATTLLIQRGSTTILSISIPASMTLPIQLNFTTPLQTAANEALNYTAGTTGASVLLNCQGYTAP